MDILDDPTFKNKYRKSKLRVKRWEHDFMGKYGRKPNKDDIRAADNSIKEAYKMYYKLKTQALEETLLDITFPDEVQANVAANTSGDSSFSVSMLQDTICLDKTLSECSMKNAENIDPEKVEISISQKSKESFASCVKPEEGPNVEGAWGSHLNKEKEEKPATKQKSLIIGRSSSFQLSRKLFSSSNLTKRNPRKSLSMNKLKNSSKSDLALNDSTNEASNDNHDGFDIDPGKAIFGENVKIVEGKAKVSSQPINAIQELINGGTSTINRNVNAGWLQRCTQDNNYEPVTYNPKRLSGTSDSGIESMDTSDPPTFVTSVADKTADFTDDEDFICNSDSEEERRNKRVRNFKKRLSDSACQQVAKRQCIDTTDNFSFSQPLPSRTINEPHPVWQNKELPVSENTKLSLLEGKEPIVENHQLQAIENPTEGNHELPMLENPQSAASKIEDSPKDRNSKTKKPKSTVSRAALKRKSKSGADMENEMNEEEGAMEEKPRTRKTTRVTRSTRGKLEDSSLSPTEDKPAPKKRATRRKGRKTEIELAEEEIEDTSEVPEMPIYAVEATEVIPRFAIPQKTSGDLINDFAKSVAPNTLASGEAGAARPKGSLTAREKLEQKVKAGKVNENFVRINIKKKVFVRGKRSFNASKYRRNQWKQRQKELSSSASALDRADFAEKNDGSCFKCGGTGHFARRCTATKSDDLLPNIGDEEPSEFLTLDEVEKLAAKNATAAHSMRIHALPKRPSLWQPGMPGKSATDDSETLEKDKDENYEELFDGVDFDDPTTSTEIEGPKLKGHKIPEDLLAKLLPPVNGSVDVVCPTLSDNGITETPDEVFQALRMFGHENFRPGQEKAVMRILSGQSTLVTLSTGSGKSLCYQLPAYIYAKRSRCITLVVSPLVSLMDDQVTGVPNFLSAAALHTGQAPRVKEQIMQTIRDGKLDILLVSPEAVVAGERSTGFGALLRQLPPIAFACIDEAHCISQWSHNFRPSYLMLCRVLMEKLGVKTILGLTATATKNTAESIVEHLNIHDGMRGVISDTPMPKNLTLTVSKDEQRDRALVDLVLSERFKECDSIIVYCTRREECTRIAAVLRVSLQDNKNRELTKAKCSPYAEAYHAGLPSSRRKAIQKSFMSGQTRIVVATVAFGMGINKANIRSVIHYNMPGSFEGYVQEVGRAGRDNLPAHCHLFLSPSKDADKLELRRHIFANGIDRHMVRRLLQKIFVPCSCPRVDNRNNGKRCPGHEVAVPIDETVRSLDITEETISTLLCYLELHPKRFITVLSSVYVNAKVSSYAGPRALKIAAQTSPPLAMAIALDMKRGISHDQSTTVEFPVVDVAAAIGWDSGVVKSHLKNLEWHTVGGQSTRSPISVKYDTLGFRVRAPGDMTDNELDEALDALTERAKTQETSAFQQLETIHASLSKFSVSNVRQCMELTEDNVAKSESLKEIIREYFRSDAPLSIVDIQPQDSLANESEIIGDVRALLCSYRDNNFTGRAVARIFHGIQSPNYSALTWSRCRFWRSHLSTDFNFICRIANREILAMRLTA